MDCLTMTSEILIAGILFGTLVGVSTEMIATKLGYKPTNYLARWTARQGARRLSPTPA